jgi:hypothetical protein
VYGEHCVISLQHPRISQWPAKEASEQWQRLLNASKVVPMGAADEIHAAVFGSPTSAVADVAHLLCLLESVIRLMHVSANGLAPRDALAHSLPSDPHYITFSSALVPPGAQVSAAIFMTPPPPHAGTHAHAHAHTHTQTHTRRHTHTHTRARRHTHTHARAHTHTHTGWPIQQNAYDAWTWGCRALAGPADVPRRTACARSHRSRRAWRPVSHFGQLVCKPPRRPCGNNLACDCDEGRCGGKRCWRWRWQ